MLEYRELFTSIVSLAFCIYIVSVLSSITQSAKELTRIRAALETDIKRDLQSIQRRSYEGDLHAIRTAISSLELPEAKEDTQMEVLHDIKHNQELLLERLEQFFEFGRGAYVDWYRNSRVQ